MIDGRIWRVLVSLCAMFLLMMAAQAQATPTPEDADALPLAISDDGGLTVSVPEGWLSQSFLSTGIVLTNTPRFLVGDEPVIPQAGEIFVQMTYSPRAPYLEPDDSVILEGVLGLVLSEFPTALSLFSAPETLEIEGFEALTTQAELDLFDVTATAYVVAVDRPDEGAWVLLTALVADGELETFAPTLTTLLTDMDIDETRIPPVTRAETLISDNGELTLTNRMIWYALNEGNTNIALASSWRLLSDSYFDGELVAGDVVFRVNLQPSFFLFGTGVETIDDLTEVALLDIESPVEVIAFTPEDDTHGQGEGRYAVVTRDPRFLGELDILYLFVHYAEIDRVLVVIGISAPGEMQTSVPLALSLVETVRYSE